MGYALTVPYTIPAAATIPNLLAGTPVEYLGGAAVLTMYASCDVAGDTFQLNAFQGNKPGEALVPLSPLPVASTAGAVKNNENFVGQFAVPANSRLVLTVNGTAAHVGRFQFLVG